MIDVESFFVPTIRGRLVYPTLQRLRRRHRRDGQHQQAAAGRPGDPVLRLERLLHIRAGRVAAERQPHAQPRASLRDARQLDCQPVSGQRRHRGHGRGRRALPVHAAPRARHRQLAAAGGLQLESAIGWRRHPGSPDRRRQAGGARRLRPHQRLRVHQHQPEHRERLAVCRGHQQPESQQRLRGPSRTRLPRRQPEQPGPDHRVRRLRVAVLRSVQLRDAARVDARRRAARRLRRHAGQ